MDDCGVMWWSFPLTSLVPSLGEGTASFFAGSHHYFVQRCSRCVSPDASGKPVLPHHQLQKFCRWDNPGTIKPSITGTLSDNEKTVNLSSRRVPTQLSCWMNDTGGLMLAVCNGDSCEL